MNILQWKSGYDNPAWNSDYDLFSLNVIALSSSLASSSNTATEYFDNLKRKGTMSSLWKDTRKTETKNWLLLTNMSFYLIPLVTFCEDDMSFFRISFSCCKNCSNNLQYISVLCSSRSRMYPWLSIPGPYSESQWSRSTTVTNIKNDIFIWILRLV